MRICWRAAIPIRRRIRPAPSTVATGTLAGLVSFGADQPGTITLSPTTSGLPQNLTSIGAPVVYNVTGNLLTAFVDSGDAWRSGCGRPPGVHAADHRPGDGRVHVHAAGPARPRSGHERQRRGADRHQPLVGHCCDRRGRRLHPADRRLHHQCRERHSEADWRDRTKTVYEDLLPGGNPDTPATRRRLDGCDAGRLPALVSVGADQPGFFSLRAMDSLPSQNTSNGEPVLGTTSASVAGGPLDTLTGFVEQRYARLLDSGDRQVYTFVITSCDGRLHVHAAGPAGPRSGRRQLRRCDARNRAWGYC